MGIRNFFSLYSKLWKSLYILASKDKLDRISSI